MASISIRERILRQLRTNVAAISGIGTVRRWDARGTAKPSHLDGIVAAGDDTADEGPQGSIGYTDKTMTVVVAVVLFADESSTDVSDDTRNHWAALVEQKLMADPAIVEAVTTQRLATDMQVSTVDGPDYEDGSVSAAVRVIVTYRHDRNNPYKYGSLITEQTEE